MAPVYEYLAAPIVGPSTVLASLPLTGVRFGSVLNGAGSITAELKLVPLPPTGDATTSTVLEQNRMYVDATAPARRCCYIVRDGIIVGAYIWWVRNYDPATQTMDLAGAELWSLLRRRRITWNATYTGQDQLTIARDILTRTQTVAGGDLGLRSGTGLSGRVRDRAYFDYDAKPVGEAVEQLAEVIDGFDFVLTARFGNGDGITRHVELAHPRRGRTAALSGNVFAWGRNITELTWNEDASGTTNSVIALGLGEGPSKVRTRITDTTAFAEGYPLLEDSISYGDVSVLDTLDGHARATLAQRSRPRTLPKVTVLGDADPPLGAYLVGDDCQLVIPEGVDPFWPVGMTESRRINAIAVTPPDGPGLETVTLTLGLATAG